MNINSLKNLLLKAQISEIQHYQDFRLSLILKNNIYELWFLEFTILSDWYLEGSKEWDNFIPPIIYKGEYEDAKKAYFLMHLSYNNSIINVTIMDDYTLKIQFENNWVLVVPSYSEYFDLAWIFENTLNSNEFYLAYNSNDKLLLTSKY